jgi:hypothetical protein
LLIDNDWDIEIGIERSEEMKLLIWIDWDNVRSARNILDEKLLIVND